MNILFLHLFLLIIVANGTPILLRYLFKKRFAYPFDLGYGFLDGKRLLGDSKTWRGIIGAFVITSLLSLLIGYSFLTGLLIAFGAMIGDLISSFIKRRLSMRTSSRALVLDQVPESLLPALLVMQTFYLTPLTIFFLVLLFCIFELAFSTVLFKIGVRRRPY